MNKIVLSTGVCCEHTSEGVVVSIVVGSAIDTDNLIKYSKVTDRPLSMYSKLITK